MPLEVLRSRLISNGFHPEEVEYSILEVLQYKKVESLNPTDYSIVSGMLQKRKDKRATQEVLGQNKCYNYHF